MEKEWKEEGVYMYIGMYRKEKVQIQYTLQ